MFEKNDIVVFRENHKWVGCIGFVNKIKKVKEDYKLMIGIPIPLDGIAYVWAMKDEVENLQCATKYPFDIECKH